MYLNTEIAREELQKIAKGRASRVPLADLVRYTLNYCLREMAAPTPAAKPTDDSVQFLERLYQLPDMRNRV